MILSGLVKSSTVDFPGCLSAVLFAPGCNFDCFYCHNRQLLGQHPPQIEIEDVLDFLDRRRNLLDGVVFSGGEPTLQEGLVDLIVKIRRMGYSVKLDTNGTNPGLLGRLIQSSLVDYVAIDLKAPWAKYPSICRCRAADVTFVQQSFRLLAASGLDWEARTTVILSSVWRISKQWHRPFPRRQIFSCNDISVRIFPVRKTDLCWIVPAIHRLNCCRWPRNYVNGNPVSSSADSASSRSRSMERLIWTKILTKLLGDKRRALLNANNFPMLILFLPLSIELMYDRFASDIRARSPWEIPCNSRRRRIKFPVSF